ncbi:hypothetical protein FRC98_11315 [Lujinxingia vulgaris]|uniref:Uncharacterized protein n=1 Tax=Lujinxingia vulgaris TaxID=2600176 RepID=A0A5C6XDG0_9DELT|nr:hypothetical protein FRC98_11315 [Lujinxingia vulgaris]
MGVGAARERATSARQLARRGRIQELKVRGQSVRARGRKWEPMGAWGLFRSEGGAGGVRGGGVGRRAGGEAARGELGAEAFGEFAEVSRSAEGVCSE